MSSTYFDALHNAPIEKSVRRNLTVASPTDSVYSLVTNMIGDNIGAAVVIEGGRWIGIITEKDILERVIIPEKNPHQIYVKDVMTKSPISVEATRSIKEVLEIMEEHKIRRLIVTKKGRLFGLVTERRILELVNYRLSDLFAHLIDNKG